MIRPYRIMPRFDDGFSMDKQSGYPGMPNISMPDPSMMGSMDPMTQRIYASAMQDRAIDDAIQSAQLEQAQQNVIGDNLANEVMARMMEDRAQQQAVRDIRRAASDRRRSGGGSGNTGGSFGDYDYSHRYNSDQVKKYEFETKKSNYPVKKIQKDTTVSFRDKSYETTSSKDDHTYNTASDIVKRMWAAYKKDGVSGANGVLNDRSNKNVKVKKVAMAMFNQQLRDKRKRQALERNIKNGFQRASHNLQKVTTPIVKSGQAEHAQRVRNQQTNKEKWKKAMSIPNTSNFNRFVSFLKDTGML